MNSNHNYQVRSKSKSNLKSKSKSKSKLKAQLKQQLQTKLNQRRKRSKSKTTDNKKIQNVLKTIGNVEKEQKKMFITKRTPLKTPSISSAGRKIKRKSFESKMLQYMSYTKFLLVQHIPPQFQKNFIKLLKRAPNGKIDEIIDVVGTLQLTKESKNDPDKIIQLRMVLNKYKNRNVVPDVDAVNVLDTLAELKDIIYDKPNVGDRMACEIKSKGAEFNFFDPSPIQISNARFSPHHKVKNKLLVAGAGSGKTFMATSIMSNWMAENRQILWVARKSLHHTPTQGLYRELGTQHLRNLVLNDEIHLNPSINGIPTVLRTAREKYEYLVSEKGTRTLRSKQFNFNFNGKQRIITEDELAEMVCYHFTGEGSARAKQLHDMQFSSVMHPTDLFYQTLIICDEAHNLAEGVLLPNESKNLDEPIEIVPFKEGLLTEKNHIYGNNIYPSESPITKRDLIALAFYESYRISGDDSVKSVFLTATPASTNPLNLFWLLNVGAPDPRSFLEMNVMKYFDPVTKKLREESRPQFDNILHGRVSYLETHRNGNRFARKIFKNSYQIAMPAFYEEKVKQQEDELFRQIEEKYGEDVKENSDNFHAIQTLIKNFYRDRAVSVVQANRAQVYSDEQINRYEYNVTQALQDETKFYQQQEQFYHENVEAARKAFKVNLTKKDQEIYEAKRQMWLDWKEKELKEQKQNSHQTIPMPSPDFHDILVNPSNPRSETMSYEQWMKTTDPVYHIPIKIREDYKNFYNEYDAWINDGQQYVIRDRKIPEKFRPILDQNNKIKTLTQYATQVLSVMGPREFSPETKELYDRLVDKYHTYKQMVAKWRLSKADTLNNRLSFRQLSLPVEVREILSENGEELTIDQWFTSKASLNKYIKPKSKKLYSKNQSPYIMFLIRDPDTLMMRIRTLKEFMEEYGNHPRLIGDPQGPSIQFSMWTRRFGQTKSLLYDRMKYYCPAVHKCLNNVLAINAQHVQNYNNKMVKQMIFSFSTWSPQNKFAGSRTLASFIEAHPAFHVLLVYETHRDENGSRFRVLNTDKPENTLGVAILVSPETNIKHYYQTNPISFTRPIKNATLDAFNNEVNKYGDLIDLFVLEGVYVEGISLFDVGATHILGGKGVSKFELEQAVSRAVRNCGSRNLPFFPGLGALNELYFYDLTFSDGQTMYDRMMSKLDSLYVQNIAATEICMDLLQKQAIDYWLNFSLNNFTAQLSGRVVEISRKFDGVMVIEPLSDSFILKPPYNRMFVPIKYIKTDQFSVNDVVDFELPYGVEVARDLFNIGRTNGLEPEDVMQQMIENVNIPEVALDVGRTSYRNTQENYLMGNIAMMQSLWEAGGTGVTVDFMHQSNGSSDDVFNVLRWHCNVVTDHPEQDIYKPQKQYNKWSLEISPPELFADFLNKTADIVFLPITTQSIRCDNSVKNINGVSNMNMLIYIPALKTIELFNPLGYSPELYGGEELDAHLINLIEAERRSDITYMSSAVTGPRTGLLKHQYQESINSGNDRDSVGYSRLFNLLFMHLKIMYFTDQVRKHKEGTNQEVMLYPKQFRNAILAKIKEKNATAYMRGYAEQVIAVKDRVLSWRDYNDKKSFWKNGIMYLELAVLANAHKKNDVIDWKHDDNEQLKYAVDLMNTNFTPHQQVNKGWFSTIGNMFTRFGQVAHDMFDADDNFD